MFTKRHAIKNGKGKNVGQLYATILVMPHYCTKAVGSSAVGAAMATPPFGRC